MLAIRFFFVIEKNVTHHLKCDGSFARSCIVFIYTIQQKKCSVFWFIIFFFIPFVIRHRWFVLISFDSIWMHSKHICLHTPVDLLRYIFVLCSILKDLCVCVCYFLWFTVDIFILCITFYPFIFKSLSNLKPNTIEFGNNNSLNLLFFWVSIQFDSD